MEKILTIAIPTYNMEKYLERCLSSLLAPSAPSLLEVLIVNDGSKDRSLEIARRFEHNYPDQFRVIDKENGNYGSCVNRGLKEAKGRYFKVLDSDDSFATDALESYLSFLCQQDADLIVSDFEIVDLAEGKNKIVNFNLPVGMEFSLTHFVKKKVPYVWMHAIAHKTEKLRALHYQQLEGISYTDKEFVFYPIAASQTVSYFPQVLYRYAMGREGQTVDDSVWKKNYWMDEKATMRLVDLYVEHRDEVTVAARRFMRQQLKIYLSSIYFSFLMRYRNAISLNQLIEFDRQLLEKSEECYHLADFATEKPHFHYVTCWRKGQYKNIKPFLIQRVFHRVLYYVFRIRLCS